MVGDAFPASHTLQPFKTSHFYFAACVPSDSVVILQKNERKEGSITSSGEVSMLPMRVLWWHGFRAKAVLKNVCPPPPTIQPTIQPIAILLISDLHNFFK